MNSVFMNSTTLIINQEKLTLHPHFAERDFLDTSTDDKLCYIVPAVSLAYNTRYLVVIQNLRDSGGKLLPPNPLTKAYIDAYLSADDQNLKTVDPRYRRLIQQSPL